MELSKIITIQIGARYRRQIRNNLSLLNAEDIRISFAIRSNPITFTIKIQVHKAAIGIMTELLKKSKKSRIVIPRGVTKSQMPKPKAHAVPTTKVTIPMIRIHFFRPQPV